MATVSVATAASSRAPAVNRAVTLKTSRYTLTLPITSPKVEYTDLGHTWTMLERYDQQPLAHRGALKLDRMRLEVTAVPMGSGTVASVVNGLRNIQRDSAAITVAYSSLEVGQWWLTDMTVTSEQRAPGTHEVVQATISLQFLRAAANPAAAVPARVPAPAKAPTTTSTKATAAPTVRTVVVKAGDTLSRIAASVYGHADYWPRIATANNLRNPNMITPGQRLKVP